MKQAAIFAIPSTFHAHRERSQSTECKAQAQCFGKLGRVCFMTSKNSTNGFTGEPLFVAALPTSTLGNIPHMETTATSGPLLAFPLVIPEMDFAAHLLDLNLES
jgi:hypothetical protein